MSNVYGANAPNPYQGSGQGQGGVVVGQNIVTALNSLVQIVTTINNNLSGTFLRIVPVPANSTASGVPGTVAYTGSFFYVCVSSNQWARATMTTGGF